MNNVTLYSKSKSGKTLQWKASTDYSLNSDGHISIHIEWGQLGGKIQQKLRLVKSGKNISKINETTIQQQAELELSYLYKDQLESGYFLSIEDYKEPITAQLAHKFKDKKHKIELDGNGKFKLNYYGQRKLNGIRCLIQITDSDTPIKFISRSGKQFRHFPKLDAKLKELFKVGDIIDGELFHHNISFESIVTLVNSDDTRKVIGTNSNSYTNDDIEYHIYDCIPNSLSKDDSFIDRFVNYVEVPYVSSGRSDINPLCIVESSLMTSFEEVKVEFSKYIEEGYEGLMLRNGEGSYEFGIRSINLLKYKEMEQTEFEIIETYLASNDDSKVMFVLKNHFNDEFPYNTFDCAIKGDKIENMKYFKDRDIYIGKYLTVDYQCLSKYNVPLFGVGIVIRDGEVVNGKFEPTV